MSQKILSGKMEDEYIDPFNDSDVGYGDLD